MDNIFDIKKNSLIAYYQGLFNRNRIKIGCELLIRQNHPIKGIVSPGEFLPDYEQTKLISSIDLWSVEEALKWQKKNPQLYISSNISGTSLMSDDFLTAVKSLAEIYDVKQNYVTLEITEEDDILLSAREKCEYLKTLGFQIALDDWGTKNSGANRLFSLPIDIVKIDRLLIQNLSTSCCILREHMRTTLSPCLFHPGGDNNQCKATILVKNMIVAAHEMSMMIVAEGVETSEQFEILFTLNCDLFQGYFLEQPKPQ